MSSTLSGTYRFAATPQGVKRISDKERVITPANAASMARDAAALMVARLAKEYGEATSDTTRARIAAEIADLRGMHGAAVMNTPRSVPMPTHTTTVRVLPNIVPATNSDGTVKRDTKGGVLYKEQASLEGKTFQRRWSRKPGASQTFQYRSDAGTVHRVGNTPDLLVPQHLREIAGLMGK